MAAVALQSSLAAAYGLPSQGSTVRARHCGKSATPSPFDELRDCEWQQAYDALRRRQHDSCAVCQQPFGYGPQVVLGCRHALHAACFTDYEASLKTKRCPTCRTVNGGVRPVLLGREVCRHMGACIIQALWRGHHARKLYFKLLLEHDPELRRQYHYSIVRGLTERYVHAAEDSSRRIDALLADLDRTRLQARLQNYTQQDWQTALEKAVTRGSESCPICMQSISPIHGPSPDDPADPDPDALTLLSCSHVFHSRCFATLEAFALENRNVATRGLPAMCPVCRSAYISRPFTLACSL